MDYHGSYLKDVGLVWPVRMEGGSRVIAGVDGFIGWGMSLYVREREEDGIC